MAFCTKCGNQLSDGDNFCAKCGSPVNKTQTAPVAAEAKVNNAPTVTPAAAVTPATANVVINKSGVKDFIKQNKLLVAIFSVGFVLFVTIFIVIVSSFNNCDVKGCHKNHVKGYDYCYSHKCTKCGNRRATGSIYCTTHKTTSSSSSSSASSAVSAILDLKFSNIKITHNSLYTVVTGTVTNNGTKNYRFVTVKGAFKDASGKVVDTDSTYAVGAEGLAKGESKQFRMSIDKNTKVKSCTVTITSFK